MPKDIKLTPLTLAVWYCDDGTNECKTRRAKLCTDGFTADECQFLVDRLKEDLDIDAFVYRNKIKIACDCYVKFIEMIKSHIIWDCFQYKIKYTPLIPQFGETSHSAKLTEIQARNIFDLYKQGHHQYQIAKMLNVSRGAISSIMRGENWKHLGLAKVDGLCLKNTSGHTSIFSKNSKWEVKFKKQFKTYYGGIHERLDDAIIAREEIKLMTWEEYEKSKYFKHLPLKLSEEDIDEIFKASKNGFTQKEIAKKFNVSQAYINVILKGKRKI